MPRIRLQPDTPYYRTLNIRHGRGTRRSSEPLQKSSRRSELLESFIEACHARALDLDRNVKSFVLHPEPLIYEYEGMVRRAFSDVKIWRTDNTIAVREVKPERARQDSALQHRFSFIKEAYADQGIDFDLVYGDDLFRLPRRHNIDLILRARREAVPEARVECALALLRNAGSATIAEIRAASGMTTLQVLWLVGAGHAVLDLDQSISPATVLTP